MPTELKRSVSDWGCNHCHTLFPTYREASDHEWDCTAGIHPSHPSHGIKDFAPANGGRTMFMDDGKEENTHNPSWPLPEQPHGPPRGIKEKSP